MGARSGNTFPLGRRLAGRMALVWVMIVGWAGCIHEPPTVGGLAATAPVPEQFWKPPAQASPKLEAATPPQIPEELAKSPDGLVLTEIVDLALRNNPSTKASWNDARAAADRYGSQIGSYFPSVDVSAGATYNKSTLAKTTSAAAERTSYGGNVSLSYLLFDSGGRRGAVDAARQALFAADWTHNATVQDVVLQVELAFYQYVAAKALLESQKTSLEDARVHLEAAEERHRVGVATIADVLQAKTAVSQAQLLVETTQGLLQSTRGALAASMGFPANVPYDVQAPPNELPIQDISAKVDDLIQEAVAKRPDLASARAQAEGAKAHVRDVRSRLWPTLNASGSVGRTWQDGGSPWGDNYTGALEVQIPIFNGFSRTYDVLEAKARAEAAQARALGLEQLVISQVWTDYSNLQTATQRVRTSKDLLSSAEESREVALGRYKEGLGSILDLLTAESALADARSQRIQAALAWFSSLAQLACDTGILGIHGESGLLPSGGGP